MHMKLSHGSCQQWQRSLFPMAFSCCCFGRMKGQSGPFDEHTDNSQHHYVPQPFLSEGRGSVLPPGDFGVVTDEELIEGIIILGLPSGIDRHLRASTVWIRSRDGDHRSLGSAGGSGPRCRRAQRVHRSVLCSSHTRETFTMKRWDEDKPSDHRFITGSVVRLSRRYPPRKAAPGPYHVVAQLAPRDGQLQYRIKSGCEPFYRTVTENELESDGGVTVTVAAS